ncbi:MAG: zinc ABC transporter substrate-binding protein [Opitutales bacterium]|nr:zinc ABC transporter substrate-binding protein [Opitutales bacterium]MCH8540637.1 metal ABC transporter substrate-binding protein [Opitutales bacterium]
MYFLFAKNLFRLISLSAILLLAACQPPEAEVWPENPGGNRLQIVTSFSLLQEWVEAVGGDAVVVRSFVGPEGDPHTYQARPGDLRKMVDAAVVFGIGFEFESWLPRLHRSSETPAPLILLAESLPAESLLDGHHCDEHEHGHDHHHHHDHLHDLPDPHLWMDIRMTQKLIDLIEAELTTIQPEQADVFAENAKAYQEKLTLLDRQLVSWISTVPEENRKLFTGHDVFAYFAERFGFEVIGSALGSASTETKDPGAGEIRELIQRIRDSGVQVVFPEAGSDSRAVRRIAEEADVAVAPDLYTDYLSLPDGPAYTYTEMMRHNVRTIVEALGGTVADEDE